MLNKAMIIGNLCDDPEMRSTQSGTPVANMTVATNREWTDDRGEKQEDAEFHRIVVFGNQAQACGDYLEKGRQVYVEGRIQTNEWEDRDGNTNYTTEIVAQTVQFLSGGSGGGGQQKPPTSEPPGGFGEGGGGDDEFSDDIPF